MKAFYDFIQGQKDCREGKPHEEGKSKEYNSGYAFEYQTQEILTHRTEKQGE